MKNPTIETNRDKSGFFIEVGCPGCGGRLELDQDFFVLECEHCGSVLRITMPDIPPAYLIRPRKAKREIRFLLDRHLKQHSQPLTGSDIQYRFVYYPYWKIDAVVLKKRNKVIERQAISENDSYGGYGGLYGGTSETPTVQEKRTDISLAPYVQTQAAGIQYENLPYTIGMRAEYLKAIPFSEDNIEEEFECFPVLKPWDLVCDDLVRNIDSLGKIDILDCLAC
ncbi:MAG: hypothetical protein JSV44_00285, partial [Candidatus Zixiibacteriota bacterium]